MEEDNKVVEENISCTEFSLGSFELKEQGRLLDIERSFNIGLGMFSVPTFLKLVFWGLSLYTLVIDIIAHVHQDFYLAFVTSWTLIHSIVYLTGSVLLTIFPFPSVPTEGKNRLIKFVWLYQSLVLVHGSFATVIYWSMYWVPEKGLGFMGSTIWTHGGVLLLCLLNGLVVDRTPIRLKHISINIIWGVLYLLWAILQNTAIQYNPYDDDDDDAIYKYIKFRTRPKEAVVMSALSILVVLPALQTVYWALSKPGRKYVKREEDTETQVSVV